MRNPLASSWAKLDRAKQHADLLQIALAEATDPQQHEITFDGKFELQPGIRVEGKTVKLVRVRIVALPELTDEHSLLLGETLQGFRDSLDHMAWTLVKRKGHRRLTVRKAERVAFPMARKRRIFWKDLVKSNLPGVPKDPFLTLIERYQPYRRSSIGRGMRALRNLSNTDKHRFVIPLLMPLASADLTLKLEGGEPVGPAMYRLHRGMGLKAGTEVIRATVATIPGVECSVTVYGKLQAYPVMPERTHTEVRLALKALGQICTRVLTEVEPLL